MKCLTRLLSDGKTTVSVLIVLVAVGVAVGMAWFPAIGDDLKFMSALATGPDGTSSSVKDALVRGLDFWLANDNLRISNLLAIYLLWFPRAVTALLTGIAVWAIMKVGTRLAGTSGNVLLSIVLTALFLVAYPWADQLYLVDFQINYIWPTAISLWIVLKLTERGGGRPVLVAVACFVLGWMHEAFAVGIAGLICMLMLLSDRFRSPRHYVWLACLLPGLVTIAARQLAEFNGMYFATRRGILALYALPAAAFVLMAGVYFIRGIRSRKGCGVRPDRTVLLSLLFLAVTETAVMLAIPTGPRTGALGVIASVIGVCCLLRAFPTPRFLRVRVNRICVSAVLTAMIFIHIVMVDIECFKAYGMTRHVVREYIDDPDRPIFVDMTLRPEASVWCLQKPYYDWFGHSRSVKLFRDFYGGPQAKPLRVLPSALRHIDFRNTRPLNGDLGLRIYYCHPDRRPLLIGPAELPEPYVNNLEKVDGSGARRVRYYVVPIGGGSRWAWYYPEHTDLSSLESELEKTFNN